MKKLYTIASTLMLSMSMALMTSCSSDNDLVNDKPVLPEQGARTVTLKATADMSAESRVAVEGVEGKEDAFRITGWKNGDVVKVLALKEDGLGQPYEITFTYDASTETFTGTVPPLFELSELKYAYVGGSLKLAMFDPITTEWDLIEINTPIAISNPEYCFLFGNVSVDGESISANLSAPYALACVHNNTSADIQVGQITNWNDYFKEGLLYAYESTASSFTFISGSTLSVGDAEKFTVPAGQKAYFVIPPMDEGGNNYGLYDFTHNTVIAAPKNITLGKVYKVQVNSAPATTGTAKRTGNIDVNWVQLWAGGPKFAEYNVGVTDGKAESYGGHYTWGGYTDADSSYKNTGSSVLSGDDDTASKLWGDTWRMPTMEEIDALLINCTYESTLNYNDTGVSGIIITGKGSYSSNSIFLPAAGYYEDGVFSEDFYVYGLGFYWSSTPEGNGAYMLRKDASGLHRDSQTRVSLFSVRAVLK